MDRATLCVHGYRVVHLGERSLGVINLRPSMDRGKSRKKTKFRVSNKVNEESTVILEVYFTKINFE